MAPRDALVPSRRWRRSLTGRAVLRRARRAVAEQTRPLVGWAAIAAWCRQAPATVLAWHQACPMPLTETSDGPTATGPALEAYYLGPFATWARAQWPPRDRRPQPRPPLT